MIGRLRGTLAERSGESILVDVGGVGYEVAVTPRDLTALPAVGEEVVIHTYLHVREDQLGLFGFAEVSSRNLFRLLLGASGVGPKLGLAMLATLGPNELRAAVVSDDVAALTAVPGIGTRTAQKLILELRARLELPEGELPSADTAMASLRQALEGLGYGQGEIREATSGLDADEPVEDLLRTALQRLGGS